MLDGAGGLGAATGSVGIGAGVVVILIDKDVLAFVDSGADVSAGDDVVIRATSVEDILAFAASLGASTTAGIAVSVVVVLIDGRGDGQLVFAGIGSNSTVHAAGDMTIEASDKADKIELYTGGLAAGSTAGVGAAASIIIRKTDVVASIGAGASIEFKGATGLVLTADHKLDINLVAVGGAVGGTAGVAGSATVGIYRDHTYASIGDGALVNANNSGAAPTQSAVITATDTTKVLSVAGALAIGGTAGVGLGASVEVLEKDTQAWIDRSAVLNVTGNVTVAATSHEDVLSISAGVSIGGTAGIAVNAAVSVYTIVTRATVRGGPLLSDGAIVDAGGSVNLAAAEATELKIIAGNLAISGTVSVGAAAAVPVITKTTESFVGQHAAVNARGNGAGLTVNSGQFDVNVLDTRFDPMKPGAVNANTIELGYEHGYHDGDQVVYYSGGNAPIGGLEDGRVYYVKTVPGEPTKLQLQNILKPIQLRGRMLGTDATQKLVKRVVDGSGNEVDGATLSFNASTNISQDGLAITIVGHNLATGDKVRYSANGSLALPGLSDKREYYVIVIDANTIKLAIAPQDVRNGVIALSGGASGRSHRIVSTLEATAPGSSGQTLDPRLDVSGNVITLPYTLDKDKGSGVSPLETGDAVRYFSGSGTPIGGLADETTYFAIVGGSCSPGLCLATTKENATAGTAIALDKSVATGNDHSIILEKETPFGGGSDLLGLRSVSAAKQPDFHGLAVTASNSDDLVTVGVSGAIGTVAVAIAGSVNVHTTTTKAYINDDARINQVANASAAPGQTVLVAAGSNFRQLGIAGVLALGEVGVAPGAEVRIVKINTDAFIGDRAVVDSQGDVRVVAGASEHYISIAVGIAGGLVGIGGAVSVSLVNVNTHAWIGVADVDAGGNVLVRATDDTDMTVITGALGAGLVGIGASVGISIIKKDTRAFIAEDATVDAHASGPAALGGVHSGAIVDGAFQKLVAFSGLAVQAASSEKLLGIAAAAGLGFVGVAAAVGVAILESTTVAQIGARAQINTRGTVGGSVNVTAANALDAFTFAGGLGIGFVGGAGAVDIGVANNSTSATIGAGAVVRAAGNVDVHALSIKDVTTIAISVGAGFVGVAGSVSVWSVGAESGSRYADGTDGAEGPEGPGSKYKGNWDPNRVYTEGDVVTAADGNRYALRHGDSLSSAPTTVSGADTDPLKTTPLITPIWGRVDQDPLHTEKGDARDDADKAAAGDDYDNGNPDDHKDGFKKIIASLGKGPAGDKTSQRIKSSTAGANATIAANAPAGGSIKGSITSTPAPAGTVARIDAGARIVAGASVNVLSREKLDFLAVVGSVSAGFVAIGASIHVVNLRSRTDASIGANASVSAGGDINVDARLDERSHGIGFTAGGGFVSFGAQVTVINDSGSQHAHIDDGVVIPKAGGRVSVTAHGTRVLQAETVSVNAGLAAVGAAIAIVNGGGFTKATIGSALIGQDPLQSVGAVNVAADSTILTPVTAVTVQAGALALNAAVGLVKISPEVRASIGPNAIVRVTGGVTVSTQSTIAGPVRIDGIVVGLLAVGATVGIYIVNATVTSAIDTNDTIVAGGAVTVATTVNHVTDVSLLAVSGGGAKITGAFSKATNRTDARAFIGDRANITAGTVSVLATGTGATSANMDGGSGAAIGGGVIWVLAEDLTILQAYVGPASGPAANAFDPATITTTGPGGVTISATLTQPVLAKSYLIGVGILFEGGHSETKAIANQRFQAFMGDRVAVNAGPANPVTVSAVAILSAVADGTGVAASLGVAAGQSEVTVSLTPTGGAFHAGGGSISGGTIVFRTRLNSTEAGTPIRRTYDQPGPDGDATVDPAYGEVTLGSGALGIGISGATLTVDYVPTLTTGVSAGTTVAATGAVSVTTLAYEAANGVGWSVAIGLGGARGYPIVNVTAGGSITTKLDGALTSATSLIVRSTATATAAAVGSGVAVAFGGTRVDNEIRATVTPTITSRLGGSAVVTGLVDVGSIVGSDASAEALGVSVALGGAGNKNNVSALLAPDIVAAVRNVTSASGDVVVRALNNYTGSTFPLPGTDSFDATRGAHATMKAIQVALGVTIGETALEAADNSSTTARVLDGASVSAPNGAVVVASRTPHLSVPKIESVSVGPITFDGSKVTSIAAGSVRASIDDGATVAARSVDVSAVSANSVVANANVTGVALFGGAGVNAEAVDVTIVDAFIGPGPTAVHNAGLAATSVTTTGAAGVTVRSKLSASVTATFDAVGVTLLGGGGATEIHADALQKVRAVLGDQANVAAGAGSVTFDVDADITSEAVGRQIGVSLGVASAQGNVVANLAARVGAFGIGGGSISGAAISFRTSLNEGFTGEGTAHGKVYAGSGAGIGTVAKAVAIATDDSNLTTGPAGGTTISATGAVSVTSVAVIRSNATGKSLALSLTGAAGLIEPTSTVSGVVITRLDSVVTSAASVSVVSDIDSRAVATGTAGAGAGVGGGTEATIAASAELEVSTLAGGSISATGDITIESLVRSSVLSDFKALAIGGGGAAAAEEVIANDHTATTAAVSGSASSTSGNVSVHAFHNYDGVAFLTENDVRATASATVAAIGLALGAAKLNAIATATAEAALNAGGTLAAPNGKVSVLALSANYALAQLANVSGAAINVGSFGADPTAVASGWTLAKLLGNVRTVVGAADASGAQSVDVFARSQNLAVAGMKNEGGGAISITSSKSTSTGAPFAQATIGSSSSVIISALDVSARSDGFADSDSSTYSATGAAIDAKYFEATAAMDPVVGTTVGGGAQITSLNGSVFIDATANKPPTVVSDGTFDGIAGVNGATNTISFSLIHNATTGDVVVYDRKGLVEVGGIDTGRSYSVIATGPRSLQLGTTFGSAAANTELDLIDFGGREHHLQTGDIVFYSVTSTPATVVGGLGNGGQYRVFKVDDFKLKLQAVAITTRTVSVNASSVSNSTDRIVVSNSFVNGDYVTYHAPAALAEFSSRQVNVVFNPGNPPTVPPTTTFGNFNVFLTVDANNDGVFDDIGLQNGERVFYSASVKNKPIGGLVSDTYYYVIRVSGQSYQFADSFCHAVGCDGGPGNDGLLGTGDDPPDIPVTILGLAPELSPAEVVHSLWRANNAPIFNLLDDRGYYVVGCTGACGTSFQLSSGAGGAAINIDNGGNTGGLHSFSTEGVNLTAPAADGGGHKLVLDIAPSTQAGTQQLVGIGGIGFAALSGDGVVSASATGAGGGAIQIGEAQSKARLKVTLSTTVGAGAVVSAGDDVTVTTNGFAIAKTISSNDGGGAISLGKSGADTLAVLNNRIDVQGGVRLNATDDVTISSRSDLRPVSVAGTGQGSFLGGTSITSATVHVDYATQTIIAGAVQAGDVATVESHTSVDATGRARADLGGAAGSTESYATVLVGYGDSADNVAASAFTHTELAAGSNVTARTVRVNALVDQLRVVADAESRGITPLGGNSVADGRSKVAGSNQVTLRGNSTIVGAVSTAITSEYRNVLITGRAKAECICFAGSTRPTAEAHADTDARVVAYGTGPAARITTADLTVAANQQVIDYKRDPTRLPGLFDVGWGTKDGDAFFNRHIFWEAKVVMLGDPNPSLEIDATGKITNITNVVFDSGGVTYDDDPSTAAPGLGATIAGPTINVHDIVNDHGARARLLANGMGALDGETPPEGAIWGNLGVFEFQQTWDSVRLLNASRYDMVTHVIDVVNTHDSPIIEIRVDMIFDDATPGPFTAPLSPVTPGPRFDFDLKYTFAPTLVRIENLLPFAPASPRPFIRLDGYIENPIGTTHIENASGDILTGPGAELIRTNVLELVASHGDVGRQGPPRNPIAVELVRWQDATGAYHDIVVKVDAGGDAVLDLTANRRTDETLGSPFAIYVDHVNAGNDADIVLNDSTNGSDTGTLVLATVNLYNPGSTLYHFVFPTGYSPIPVDGAPLPGSGPYSSHFRPDGAPQAAARILRAFGTITTEVASIYVFNALRAGDDIDVCHVSTGGDEPKSCATTAINDATHTVTTDVPPDTTVDVLANTDVDWALASPPAELDDPGLSFDVPQIFVRTNGYIVVSELAGDLLAGHVHSTGALVTLSSTERILDANRLATIDVTGASIAMTAGTAGGIGGIGLPSVPNPNAPNPADAGNLGGFLEIDVTDAAGGVTATDTAGDAAQTQGIYLDELTGDMRVRTIVTAGDAADLSTGNVALRTVAGSIVDADDDADADVLGQAIDIDANGGSIGSAGNDLEIDSSRGSTFACARENCADTAAGLADPGLAAAGDDVALEAGGAIHVTETDGYLRLVLAHAAAGDVRISVRESADNDEDLYLVASGSARFAESNVRAPSSDPDAPRALPKGRVFSETGTIALRVGDDVATHHNSELLAELGIEIYGDAGNLDPGWGTSMILRGRIVADCVVTKGQASGDPGGTCVPETAPTPAHMTQIFGNDDVDSFQLGDPSGVAGGTTAASPGYVFLGSKTRIYGSSDDVAGGDGAHDPSIADGEDRFTVYFLQSMDVGRSGQLGANGAGHTLTLDGQADGDFYAVYTTGSRGSERQYVVNVLDTGAVDDGTDMLDVFGADNLAAAFNGYVAGSITERAPNDDIFLLRRTACIETEGPYDGIDASGACLGASEAAQDPAFVALLHGNVDPYRDTTTGNEPSSAIQRINYDAALNGRLSVYGRGGNDVFFSDDNSAVTTLDGGAGFDTFQIGQIFGAKRDCFGAGGTAVSGCGLPPESPGIRGTAGGGLKPQDVFPSLIATTRGWLSPGSHAPIVATGGTGNDEFIVYSNQAELRLDGDDDNDVFVVRAFALATVDAHGTPGAEQWQDDEIVFDCVGDDPAVAGCQGRVVARPVIGAGFSVGRPLDIRTGGGEDEVQYNVNAPVSVEGGTGFDKLVVLGTEFADDIVITSKGIFGAGMNVRYATVEVVEVDGLEGDDEFFVQSTAFGVAYRVIGGLGSDTINVTGDVTEDIVTRELEGIGGVVDHLVRSPGDPLYDGLSADGIDVNVADGNAGNVVIDESGGFTSVRENGALNGGDPGVMVDAYAIHLAVAPTANVYVTVSAARAPQQEADGSLANPSPLPGGRGDTVWVCVGDEEHDADCDSIENFRRMVMVNGVLTTPENRAFVLTFTPSNYATRQWLHVWAVDEVNGVEVDPRSEGDRVHVLQHSVISQDQRFDAVAVRNVEVMIRDNDTPGVYITQHEISGPEGAQVAGAQDGRTVVIEGHVVDGALILGDAAPGTAGAQDFTGLMDIVRVALARELGSGQTVVVDVVVDLDSAKAITLVNLSGDPRFVPFAVPLSLGGGAYVLGQLTFDASTWSSAIEIGIRAYDDLTREDPATAVVKFACAAVSSATCGAAGPYPLQNLRSGSGLLDIEVIDDDSAGVVPVESAGSTLVVGCGPPPCVAPATDDYTLRLTKAPTGDVTIAVLTDGLTDVLAVDGNAVSHVPVGGLIPARLFGGSVVFGTGSGGRRMITRGNAADLGSFVEDGFEAGQLLRVAGAGARDGDYTIDFVDPDGKFMTLMSTLAWSSGAVADVALSRVTSRWVYDGQAKIELAGGAQRLVRLAPDGTSLTGTQATGWLGDGFLEGQRVRICAGATCVDRKIGLIRGDNGDLDNKLELTAEGGALPWSDGMLLTVHVERLAVQLTFTAANWYVPQNVTLSPDPYYALPPARVGVKVFPATTHLLSKLRGPLAVEGGVIGSDRSLRNGVKLPGESDAALFEIGLQPPETKSIDVLNIYADSSRQDGSGTMTSTSLKGFGMAKDLAFGGFFGEPAVFPGGISFGAIAFDGTNFVTDGAKTTIEVLNLLLGQGNDNLDIQGTLDPRDAAVAVADVDVTRNVTVTPLAGAGATVFSAGFDWRAAGFEVGQLVFVDGLEPKTWRLVDISADRTTLTLHGDQLGAFTGTRRLYVAGQHGGLTVVHGGGNMPLETTGPLTVASGGGFVSLTRLDGFDWRADGYAATQWIQIAGETGTRQIVSFGNSVCAAPAAGETTFPGCGGGSVMVLAGSATAGTFASKAIHVAEPLREQATAPMQISTSALTRTDAGSFVADGFSVGQQVWISGIAGPWTISALAAKVMTLQGAALTPTLDAVTLAPVAVSLTVFGYDAQRDGGTRIGGDRITVCSATSPIPCGPVVGGPSSPLVVYGDTSQDGDWYAGHPYDVKGYEFGDKPFDPFVGLPDADNEDDEWVFPLADPFTYAGNDVIDASGLLATLACNATCSNLPTVGFTAYGGAGNDTIVGSQAGDHLAGGSGDDTISGGRGADHIYGDSGFNVDILTRALTVATSNASPRPTLDRDVLYGEGAGTVAGGPQGAYDDVIFGDHGAIVQQVAEPNAPDSRLQKIQTTVIASIRRIESRNFQSGGDDVIFGGIGRDTIVAGAGNDMADGDEADDMIFGDNAFLVRRVVEVLVNGIPQTNVTTLQDTTSAHFQALCGALLYSRTDRSNDCGGVVGTDSSGVLLVNGVAMKYRDPDSGFAGDLDLAPWWAEYLVAFDPDYTDADELHAFDVQAGAKGANSFGNDYLAGGAQHDVLFGQMGDDVVQGDGGIETAFAGISHVGASRTPDGCSGIAGTSLVCDVVGDLDVVASLELATDGEDYIEGNGGRDVLFGGLGQDDIVGGSSSFFGLTTANDALAGAATGGADLRPDGDDLIFGGAGNRNARNDDSDLGPADIDHTGDADVIAGDNANIVRIVGTGGVDLLAAATPKKYVTFVYDTYGTAKLVVRGVTLLDYTAGGPDFNPAAFGLVGGTGPCSGANASGVCSTPISTCAGTASKYTDVGGRDEVHGEAGDDTAYGGCGNDTLFGDAQDDDLIGGWGNDWISGGTGQDGILGDDGRVFTSRNTGCTGANCWTSTTDLSEPLFGINKFLTTDPDLKVVQGYVLNEAVYTPGKAQTATLNVGGAYKKEVDITPYNLGPNVDGAGHTLLDLPLYDANNSDDVIFGGWDSDFLHGASGDDAIAGGEALATSYVQHFSAAGAPDGLVRDDFTRPYNPGNLLEFGADVDASKGSGPTVSRLGEFYLYDEYDAGRAILFNASGTPWKTGAAPLDRQFLLNMSATEGRTTIACGATSSNGSCTLPNVAALDDGNDALFGDLGNDWLVGGTGRDDVYGGWGNDLSNADDVLTTAGSLNNVPDTHTSYDDRAYGGAGIDILIGNTTGDRLIDWVGEFNSFLVPFNAFGIGTVSRQVEPALPEFLYALSASDGADPTRDTDTGRPAARNGEFEGELGLIVQADRGYWQQQTGGPTDPQSKTVSGGARTVLKGADFNNGTQSAFAVDSGVWEVQSAALSVGAASLGQDAAAVFYADEYRPVYFEVAASIKAQKPLAGWKANAYVIFDYFSPIDFKFAGINVATNKIEMGHRDAGGWVVDVQSTAPVLLKPDTSYRVLVAVNGTTVTVTVDSDVAFTFTFAPRVLDGVAVGLNKGLVGMGSDNSRGVFDDVLLQSLPPEFTLDSVEDFGDGLAQQFVGAQGGDWTVAGGHYESTAVAAASYDMVDHGLGHGLQPLSYVELYATLRTSSSGGAIFDAYSGSDYKFVALDVAAQKIVIGHVDPRGGAIVDASVSRTLAANTDYAVMLTIKGLSVAVQIDGALALSFGFNGNVVDGAVGVLSRSGTTSVDAFRIRTNDPAFAAPPPPPLATVSIAGTTVVEGAAGSSVSATLTLTLSSAADRRRDRCLGDVRRHGEGRIGLHRHLGHGDVRRRRDERDRHADRARRHGGRTRRGVLRDAVRPRGPPARDVERDRRDHQRRRRPLGVDRRRERDRGQQRLEDGDADGDAVGTGCRRRDGAVDDIRRHGGGGLGLHRGVGHRDVRGRRDKHDVHRDGARRHHGRGR